MKCHLNPKTQSHRSRRGFTLVEMLLVLVILATLAAIVLPKLTGTSQRARVTAVQTQIGAFKTALDAFEVDNGYYPKGKNGLMDLVQRPRDAANWHGPYLEKSPLDPWGNPYNYQCPGTHNSGEGQFDLWSGGSDGRAEDLNNWEKAK